MVEYKDVTEKEADLIAVFSRMDNDAALARGDKYVMKDKDNHAIPGIVNVTLPDVKLFGQKVVSMQAKAKMQTVVKGELKDEDTTEVEDFINTAFDAADDRLQRMGEYRAKPFTIEKLNFRGSGAERILFRLKDDIVVPDIMPADTRYFVYDHDEDGLAWVSYKTNKSKAMLLRDFPEKKDEIEGLGNKPYEVRDTWDREKNRVYIEERLFREVENPLGYVPWVFEKVPFGLMLRDDNYLKYEAESIFFMVRDVFEEACRTVSIAQSVALKSYLHHYVYESADGKGSNPPDYPDGIGTTTIAAGEKYYPIPQEDINRALTRVWAILEQRLQLAMMALVEYGTLEIPLSAIALVQLGEGRDDIFLPRIDTLGRLYKAKAEMGISQCMGFGSFKMGMKGHEKDFNSSDLKGKYDIKFEFTAKSAKDDIAAYAIDRQAEASGISRHTRYTDILKLENPDGEIVKSDAELAEGQSIELTMYRRCHALVEEDKFIESEILLEKLEQILIVGEIPEPEEEKPKVQPEPLVPLTGRGGGGGGRQRTAEEE